MLTQLAATASPEGTVRRGDGLQAEQQPRGAVLNKQPVQQYRGNYPDCHGNGGLRHEHIPQAGVERQLPEHGLRKSLKGGVEEVDDVRRGRHRHEPARLDPFAASGDGFRHLEHKPDAYVREGLPNNECTFTPPESQPASLRRCEHGRGRGSPRRPEPGGKAAQGAVLANHDAEHEVDEHRLALREAENVGQRQRHIVQRKCGKEEGQPRRLRPQQRNHDEHPPQRPDEPQERARLRPVEHLQVRERRDGVVNRKPALREQLDGYHYCRRGEVWHHQPPRLLKQEAAVWHVLARGHVYVAAGEHEQWHVERVYHVMHGHVPPRRAIRHVVSDHHEHYADGLGNVDEDNPSHLFKCVWLKKQAAGLGLEHPMRSHTKLLADSKNS